MSSRQTRRNKKGQNKGKQQQPPPAQKPKKTPWQWLQLLSPTGKVVAGVCAILTLFAAYLPFYPKITVTSSYSLDTSTPFSTKFDVHNDSLLRINEIKPILNNVNYRMEGGGGMTSHPTAVVRTTDPPIPYLSSGETTSFVLPLTHIKTTAPIESADVTVRINYRHFLLPFKQSKLARFVLEKGTDGSIHWAYKAISE